jgi:hypothetical protein
MRSRRDYIVTKDEVYGYANEWLTSALRLEYEGAQCTTSTLFAVLLIAASRVVSIFAACRFRDWILSPGCRDRGRHNGRKPGVSSRFCPPPGGRAWPRAAEGVAV